MNTFSHRIRRFIFLLGMGAFLLVGTGSAFAAQSVARRWNELLLESIRQDYGKPTIHARNFFHVSIAMWDAWAAFDADASGYLLREKYTASNSRAAREEALSYASYRVLRARFGASPGAGSSLPAYDAEMARLGYSPTMTTTLGNTPAAIGNRIAARVLEFGLNDGANESGGYASRVYAPVNPALVPALPGNPNIVDLNRWQPLGLSFFVDQNGFPVVGGYPPFLTPEWGKVVPFAMGAGDRTMRERNGSRWPVWNDPGPPPRLGTSEADDYKWGFELVAAWARHLDPDDQVLWDISPASMGAARVPEADGDPRTFYDFEEGGDNGAGYAANPVTGLPYARQVVPRGDYARVLAEFWADGPQSETPPGHWFVILNHVSDDPRLEKRIGGSGPIVDDLQWDVKAYLALGGAMHDAAISAWSIKGYYDYVRPISAIRALAARGQSSDPTTLSYNPDGIGLHPGIIEVVTSATTRLRQRHRHLRGHEGEIALNTWQGHAAIDNVQTDTAGAGWILASRWWPYQRISFVTPPFAGYISGHSTFSRTAAVVLHRLTGSPFFPGGLGEFPARRNQFLVFEEGPSVDVVLQWASYYDASDQCSLSRIWGGIHPPADDLPGRRIGEHIGPAAWARAISYFEGTIQNLTVGVTSLPAAEQALPYVADLQVSGGTPPYLCRVVEGELPTGLFLADTGRITGTPSRAQGRTSLSIQVIDAVGTAIERSFEITTARPLDLRSQRFRTAREGRRYRLRLHVHGGQPPIRMAVVAGVLPTGLVLDGIDFLIEGRPLTSGTFPVSLEARDALGAVRRIHGQIKVQP